MHGITRIRGLLALFFCVLFLGPRFRNRPASNEQMHDGFISVVETIRSDASQLLINLPRSSWPMCLVSRCSSGTPRIAPIPRAQAGGCVGRRRNGGSCAQNDKQSEKARRRTKKKNKTPPDFLALGARALHPPLPSQRAWYLRRARCHCEPTL